MRYTRWVQPGPTFADDFQAGIGNHATAVRVAAWLHRATGAAVQIFDEKTAHPGRTWGAFDASRT